MPDKTIAISKRMIRWMVIVAILSPLMVTGLNVWYTNTVDDRARARSTVQQMEADRRWCSLLKVLVNPNPPPTNERSRVILTIMTTLYDSLGCD